MIIKRRNQAVPVEKYCMLQAVGTEFDLIMLIFVTGTRGGS